jgi:hypothetical protein
MPSGKKYRGGLAFTLPRFAGVKARYVAIYLGCDDLYDLVFMDKETTVIASAGGVYADALIDVFEARTGLAARMPRLIATGDAQ